MRFWLLIGIVTLLAVFPSAQVRAGDDLGWVDAATKIADDFERAEEMAPDQNHGHGPNPFAGVLDLTIWTIVVFVLLVTILYTFAWKHIREGLDRREHTIASAMEEAKAAKEEAARLREQLQNEMAKAHDQVRQILDKARQDAEALAADLISKGKSELQTERERLNRDLQTSRDQALQEIWKQAAHLSTLIASKIVNRTLQAEDHRQLIEEALAELRHSAEERKRDYQSVRA